MSLSTLSIKNALGQKPNIIQKGILYLSNDKSSYDTVTERLYRNLNSIDLSVTYAERLEMWHSFQLSLSAVCICDTSNLFETPSTSKQLLYNGSVLIKPGYTAPNYDEVYRIEPESPLEVVQLNISNINETIDYIGSFETHKGGLTKFLSDNTSSKLLERWIDNEIQVIEDVCGILSEDKFSEYPDDISYWYNAFVSDRESLNVDDYKIWMPQIREVAMYDQNIYSGFGPISNLPKLCYWFTDEDVFLSAAKAFLFTKKLAFLKELRKELIKELYPEPPIALDLKSELDESVITIKNRAGSSAKLTWQGDKKVLINALRQMKTSHNKKGQSLLKESYEDIAIFLIQHVNGFENDKISTLRGLLTKELDDPKGNFIPLDLTEPN